MLFFYFLCGASQDPLPVSAPENSTLVVVLKDEGREQEEFKLVIARSCAGDLSALYQGCLLLLPSSVTADVWEHVFGITESDKFLTEHLSKYKMSSEQARCFKFNEFEKEKLFPGELNKSEGRVQKIFQYIQDTAKGGILEASSLLKGLPKTPAYLEKQVFFECLSSLLSSQFSTDDTKIDFIQILEKINKSKMSNIKIKELLSIYLRVLGVETEQQYLVETIQKDLMLKTFSLPALCFWYSGMVIVPVVSIVIACWLYFVYCESDAQSGTSNQPDHISFSQTVTVLADKTSTGFSCKDRVDRDFRFLTIAAGCAASLPVLYNTYRAYKQIGISECAVQREAEILGTALVVLKEKYDSRVWDWQRKVQMPYYFLACWKNMKRKYSIK